MEEREGSKAEMLGNEDVKDGNLGSVADVAVVERSKGQSGC